MKAVFQFALALTDCGDVVEDQSERHPAINAKEAIKLTAAQNPVEAAEDQSARDAEIHSRLDSMLISTAFGESRNPDNPRFTLKYECTKAECVLSNLQTGASTTIQLSYVAGLVSATTSTILTKNGTTTFESRGVDTQVRTYGSVMQHGYFAVEAGTTKAGHITNSAWLSRVGGALSSSRPQNPKNAFTATWKGLMVGTPTHNTDQGDLLQGDVSLTHMFNYNTLNLAVTGIMNIDKSRSHSVTRIVFNNVAVDETGQFQQGRIANQIQGAFYGPKHAEVAGTVEQSNMVGGFGAKLQDC